MTLVAIIGEKGGCMFSAERAVVHGLRKGVNPAPVFRSLPEISELGKTKIEEGQMTVFIYVDSSKQVGDVDHLKVFADVKAANGCNRCANRDLSAWERCD